MRLRLCVAVVAAACGGSPKPPVAPIADKPAPPVEAVKPPAPPPEPPKPEPLDVKLPASKAVVKLVTPGKGKRDKLKLTPKAGVKQSVELALDMSAKQSGKDGSPGSDRAAPTLVLTGDAEITNVDKDGAADVTWTIAATDARDAPGQDKPTAQVKDVLTGIVGLSVKGTVAANGDTGELALHLDKVEPKMVEVLQVIALTFPAFPSLPAEPIGVGAKWEATLDAPVMDQIAMTEVTTYELTAHKGSTWTIKSTTKIVGKDQEVGGAKLEKIGGGGTGELTITDGALYPTLKTKLERKFTATAPQQGTVDIALTTAATITPK